MSLRKKTFAAGRWALLSSLARTGLYLIQMMVLARLLAPADFGVFAIAMVVYSVVTVFSDLGISNALIHFPKQTKSVLSSLYWLNIIAATMIFFVITLLAFPLKWLYNEPALYPALVTMASALPIAALGQQFRVLAEKSLDFSILAPIEITAAVLAFITAIILATQDGGLYSMTVPVVVSAVVSSTLSMLLLSKGFRPQLAIKLKHCIPFITYGTYRIGETLSNTLRMQTDVIIGSLFSLPSELGNYSIPRDVTLRVSNTVINPIITRVSLPLFAKVQNDKAATKSIFLSTLLLTSSVNFPAYCILMAWSDDIANLLLGSQWTQAGYFLQILALWGLIRSTGNPVGSLLYATGHVRRAFWWNLFLLILTPACLLVPSYLYSLEGLVWAMTGVQVAIFYPAFLLLVKPACQASFGEYLKQFSPSLMTSVLATGAGLAISSLITISWLQMPTGVLCTVVSYIVMTLFINREFANTLREAVPLVGPLKKRS